ncbi:hypothetical protein BDAP_001767 [Binucleata daphniae]
MLTLLESCSGYALITTEPKLSVVSSYTFKTTEETLENISELCKNNLPNVLLSFLEPNKKKKITVGDQNLCTALKNNSFDASYDINTYRNARTFFNDKVNDTDALLYCSHKLTEEKIKGSDILDIMIIQAIKMFDDLDKDINGSVMRIKEWYGCHLPELSEVVTDTEEYLKCVIAIQNKENIDADKLNTIFETNNIDEENKSEENQSCEITQKIYKIAEMSVGTELCAEDMQLIHKNCRTVLKTIAYKNNLAEYLKTRMNSIAPNLTALVGDIIGARLIAKAGSLSAMSKMAASTVQILGAEKAFFTAIKAKSNTPKYGIIFNTNYIGKAEEKGRIARILGCKIGLCSKIDYFGGSKKGEYGIKMKKFIEDRMGTTKKQKKVIKKIDKHEFSKKKKYDTSKDELPKRSKIDK